MATPYHTPMFTTPVPEIANYPRMRPRPRQTLSLRSEALSSDRVAGNPPRGQARREPFVFVKGGFQIQAEAGAYFMGYRVGA
jgi:hypothetical protein